MWGSGGGAAHGVLQHPQVQCTRQGVGSCQDHCAYTKKGLKAEGCALGTKPGVQGKLQAASGVLGEVGGSLIWTRLSLGATQVVCAARWFVCVLQHPEVQCPR
jgi:hypothetical protein